MGFVENWKQSRQDKAQEKALLAFDMSDPAALLDAVRAGALINIVDGAGYSMAHRAVQMGKIGLLEALDKSKADWGLLLMDGKTTLHLAVQSGQSLWVKAMLDRQVDVNLSSVLGSTALHLAARLGASQIIRMLDQAGASWSSKDKQGLTPLDILNKFHPALHGTWSRATD